MQAQLYLERERAKLLVIGKGPVNIDFHFHSHVELLVVERGEVEVTVNDRQNLLRAGDIAVALSYDAHSFRSDDSARALSLIIPTQLCSEFMTAARNQKLRSPFIRDEELFRKMCSGYKGIEDSTNDISRKGNIYVMLGALLEYMELENQEPQSDCPQFADVLLYLNDHFAENLSLGDVATAFGYNASYLSGAFKNRFHISMTGYLTMLRLRQAVLLMHEPGKTVTDCAYESGFQSLRTFYRAFEDEFHCSPMVYRKTKL